MNLIIQSSMEIIPSILRKCKDIIGHFHKSPKSTSILKEIESEELN
jgi:hypothetical protein